MCYIFIVLFTIFCDQYKKYQTEVSNQETIKILKKGSIKQAFFFYLISYSDKEKVEEVANEVVTETMEEAEKVVTESKLINVNT